LIKSRNRLRFLRIQDGKILSKENVEKEKKYEEFKKLVDRDRDIFHDKMVTFHLDLNRHPKKT
jgi:hypothetical protein